MNPKEIVQQGYDRISYNYRADDGRNVRSDYADWLAELTPLLPGDAPILELGCGCGVPVGQALAPVFDYTGVDISPVQIERAQKLVRDGRFLTADMTQLQFPDGAFAAILSFYAIIHLPLDEQPALFANVYRWLQPGGYFMVIVGHTAWTGVNDDFLGAKMYWSTTDVDTYQQWLAEHKFVVLGTRFIPEGDGGHTLFLAQKALEK